LTDPRECPAGVEPGTTRSVVAPAWRAGASAGRPRARSRRKERESNPQGSSLGRRPSFGWCPGGCHRQLACPSVCRSCGGRNRTCVGAVNSRLVVALRVELSATRLSAGFGQPALDYRLANAVVCQVGMAGLEPAVSCSQRPCCARCPAGCRCPTSRCPVRTAGVEPAISWPPTRCAGTRAR
jgi:hypothetical protein